MKVQTHLAAVPGIAIALGFLGGMMAPAVSSAAAAPAAASRSVESLDPRLPEFIRAKQDQARSLAKMLDFRLAPEVPTTFELFAALHEPERLEVAEASACRTVS